MVLGLLSLTVSPVFAQSPGGGLLNAVVYKDVPAGAGILVRPLDDSDDNLVLKQEFEAELQRRGFRIQPDSELVLTFETRDSIGAYTDRNARHVLELSGGGGRGGGEDARARVNVFDSASGGLINPGSESGNTEIVTPTQYRLDVTLDDKANRKRLWQAWATADIERSDGLTLTRGMVPVIVQAVGQTVRQQPFKIR
jgi:hypothetical protein